MLLFHSSAGCTPQYHAHDRDGTFLLGGAFIFLGARIYLLPLGSIKICVQEALSRVYLSNFQGSFLGGFCLFSPREEIFISESHSSCFLLVPCSGWLFEASHCEAIASSAFAYFSAPSQHFGEVLEEALFQTKEEPKGLQSTLQC